MVDELFETYSSLHGEQPDWDEFRQAMWMSGASCYASARITPMGDGPKADEPGAHDRGRRGHPGHASAEALDRQVAACLT